MCLVSPDQPDPSQLPPLPQRVTVRAAGPESTEVILRPGADRADLIDALAWLPDNAYFYDHFGDVELVLVFRRIPAGGAAIAPAPAGLPPAGDPAAAAGVPEAARADSSLTGSR